jgi:hypothetical protein
MAYSRPPVSDHPYELCCLQSAATKIASANTDWKRSYQFTNSVLKCELEYHGLHQ